MFDYGPDEGPPLRGLVSKSIPTVAVMKSPPAPALDESAAALANNDYFLCLGYRRQVYFFKSKILDRETMAMDTFGTQRILALAPLDFWEKWSGTEGKSFPRIKIMNALIRLSQKTGRFVYPYERWIAAEIDSSLRLLKSRR
jgi:hypothetical protein